MSRFFCCECGRAVPLRVQVHRTAAGGVVTEKSVGRCRLHPDAKRYSSAWAARQWAAVRAAVVAAAVPAAPAAPAVPAARLDYWRGIGAASLGLSGKAVAS